MYDSAVSDLVEDVVCGGMAKDSTNDVFVQLTFPSYLGERCLLIDREGRGYLEPADSVQADEIVLKRKLVCLLLFRDRSILPDCRSDGTKSP